MANRKISQLTAASALSGAELIPAVQSGADVAIAASALFPLPGYVSGNWYLPPSISGVAAGGAMPANTICLSPFILLAPVTVKTLGARLTTAASNAGANVALALYASTPIASAGYRPTGTPLLASGAILATTAGVIASAALTPAALSAGAIYWAAVWADSLAATATAAIFQAQSIANPLTSILVGSATQSHISPAAASVGPFLTFAASWTNPAAPSWPDLTSGGFTEVAPTSLSANTTGVVQLQAN